MKNMDQSRKRDDEEKKQKGNKKRTHHESEAERSSSAQEQRRVQPSREAKKKMKKDDHNDDAPNPRNARRMPPQFKKYIEDEFKGKNVTIGEEILVIEKKLSQTDVDRELRVSPSLIKDSPQFLTNEEENDLQKRIGGGLLNDMLLPLIEPSLEKFKVYLGRRVRKSSNPENPGTVFYVLTNTWDHVVKHRELQAGQIVQLWAVRVDGKLWLVLVTEGTPGFEPKALSSPKPEEGRKK